MVQVDGLVGAKEVLRTVPEKAAFLLALHPKDRMRLLGMASTSFLNTKSKVLHQAAVVTLLKTCVTMPSDIKLLSTVLRCAACVCQSL